ncbi:hypothetical protein PGB90_004751 [Kerria lacca]
MGKVISFLWILTPISSTISVIIVWVAMATSDWIRTQERIVNAHYNGTTDQKFILKMTYSGIWEICTVTDGDTDISCEFIEYFTSEPYYPDPADSSVAIPYAVRQSVFFFIVASIVQLFGELGYLYGHYIRVKKVFVFIGGTIFIVSGLVMLIGIVMYISVFKTEVSSKLKPNSATHSSFNFQYGVSFLLYVTGFICVELSGTCAVLLFVYQDQTVQSVHFIQPSPVIYRNYNSTFNPGMMYPCRIHPELCVAMDTLSHHSGHLHSTNVEATEMNHSCYLDPENSPPYGPASRLSTCEEFSYQYDEQDRRTTVSTQSATTQTVSTIFDPRLMNDETKSMSGYLRTEKYAPYNTCTISRAVSTDRIETLRKSTLV